MANLNYNEGIESLLDRNIDFAADTIKSMLASSVYTPNKDNQFIDTGGASDPVDARIGTDQTLGSKVILKDTTNDFVYLDAADPTYTAVAGGSTVATVEVYKDTGTPTTSKLITSLDVTDTATNGGDITVQFATPANGGVTKFQL